MDALTLMKLAAASWYVAYVLTSSDGPGGVFAWVREHVWHGRTEHVNVNPARQGWPEGTPVPHELAQDIYTYDKDGLLDCPICLSIWVALILVLVPDGIIVQALAVAGVAMWFHGFTNWRLG